MSTADYSKDCSRGSAYMMSWNSPACLGHPQLPLAKCLVK